MLNKIIFIYSTKHTGDTAYVNAVSNKLPEIERVDIDADDRMLLYRNEFIDSRKDTIIFAVGEKGLMALNYLFDNSPELKVLSEYIFFGLGIHQYFDEIKDLPIKYIAIPESAIDTMAKKVVINRIPNKSLTFAVPTENPSIEELKVKYENTKDKIALNDKYISVMLSGDAIDPDYKMKHFTKQSAKDLFDKVKALWLEQGKIHKILLQNGPRTGKYKDGTMELACAHEYKTGEDSGRAVDEISKYFISLLESENIPYNFRNFAFEIDGTNKTVHSSFQEILYVTQSSNDNYFFLPGESVSMLGQLPSYISPNGIIVFEPSSMNDTHRAIFESAKNQNLVSYYENGKIKSSTSTKKLDTNDAAKVAQDIVEAFKNLGKAR